MQLLSEADRRDVRAIIGPRPRNHHGADRIETNAKWSCERKRLETAQEAQKQNKAIQMG